MSNLVPLQQQKEQPSVSGGITIRDIEDLSRLSNMLAKSGFFADAREAAQAGVKVLAGLEMGFPTLAAMTGIHIIKGKPTIGANLMAAAVKRSGRYNYRVLEHSAELCKIAFFENGEQCGISEFTAEDARRNGTQNMDKYAKNMLFARAISNGVKWFCPDIFLGAPVYTPDELGASVDEDGNVIESQVVTVLPASEGPSNSSLISEAQRKRLYALAKDCKWNKDAVKEMLSQQYGIESSKDIPIDQYEQICSDLQDTEQAKGWNNYIAQQLMG